MCLLDMVEIDREWVEICELDRPICVAFAAGTV